MSCHPGTHEAVRRLLGSADADACCLDVGAGDNPFPFAETARARRLDKIAPHEIVDLEAMPWPVEPASRDVIVAIEVVEHVENPWAFFRELRRIVRPGGLAIVTTPNPLSARSRRMIAMGGWPPWFEPGCDDDGESHGHLTCILPHLLDAMARRAGFAIDAVDFAEDQDVRAIRCVPR